ncbi:MAG: DUF4037 domain-containing protein [Nocardioidaceae bacterium]
MPVSVPAIRLCRDFYASCLRPVIPVTHAAGLLGGGSDVLGYDTERSTDHDWGPRATVFVAAADVDDVKRRITGSLPDTFGGWPVRMGRDRRPLTHHVEVTTLPRWTTQHLGVDPQQELTAIDWLLIPQQRLLGVTQGAVFADPVGSLAAVRDRLRWYPDDVWWWMLACQWRRLAQEEAFVQRTDEVGDAVGPRVVTARLVRDAMRLALLMQHRCAPYIKWLGTAFSHQPDVDGLGQRLAEALDGTDLVRREAALCDAFSALARRFKDLGGGDDLDPAPRRFHDRPALVLDADRFARSSLRHVSDETLRRMPLVGSVDQLADTTDLLNDPQSCRELGGF